MKYLELMDYIKYVEYAMLDDKIKEFKQFTEKLGEING